MRRARATLAVLCGVAAIALAVDASSAQRAVPQQPTPDPAIAQGRSLFAEECSSCHGFDARGIAGRGPDLRGAGAAAADFYLRTGRMPLSRPDLQPMRSEPRYDPEQLDALIAYVGSLGGPRVPTVDPEAGSVSDGQQLFTSYCSGCHAITGVGGVAVGAYAPNLRAATPTQVAEAIRVGPYLMPAFGRRQLSDADVDSIAGYVSTVVDDPADRGGWGIGHIGPVPEGMVAWLLAAVALVLVAALIGERRGRQE